MRIGTNSNLLPFFIMLVKTMIDKLPNKTVSVTLSCHKTLLEFYTNLSNLINFYLPLKKHKSMVSYCFLWNRSKPIYLNSLKFYTKFRKVSQFRVWFILNSYFMPLVSFYIPWKYQKMSNFLMFSGGTERNQWHQIG